MVKKLDLDIPKGFEIDLENSDLATKTIILKKIKTIDTYTDVENIIFASKEHYNASVRIRQFDTNRELLDEVKNLYMTTYSLSVLKTLQSLVKLINTAKILNGEWTPIFDNSGSKAKTYLIVNSDSCITNSVLSDYNIGVVYFRTKELALEAVRILGEEVVKQALTLNL